MILKMVHVLSVMQTISALTASYVQIGLVLNLWEEIEKSLVGVMGINPLHATNVLGSKSVSTILWSPISVLYLVMRRYSALKGSRVAV